MYRLLEDIKFESDTKMSYVSVGHRPSLLNYHQMRLRLNSEEGIHQLEVIETSELLGSIAKNM